MIDEAWEYWTPDADLWGHDDEAAAEGPSSAQVYEALRTGGVSLQQEHGEATGTECGNCGRPIRTRADHAGSAKFCSQVCYHSDRLANPRPTRTPVKKCEACGEDFLAKRSTARTCSPQCGAVIRRGPRKRKSAAT